MECCAATLRIHALSHDELMRLEIPDSSPGPKEPWILSTSSLDLELMLGRLVTVCRGYRKECRDEGQFEMPFCALVGGPLES